MRLPCGQSNGPASEFQEKAAERSGRKDVLLFSAADGAGLPPPARWIFRHHRRDPAPDTGDYWFDIADIRTEANLLAQTAHFMEKNWIGATNRDDVIREVGETDWRARGGDPGRS